MSFGKGFCALVFGVSMMASSAEATRWVCQASGTSIQGKSFSKNGEDRISRSRAMAKALNSCRSSVVPRARWCKEGPCWAYSGKF